MNITLKSGKVIYANHGIIGLTHENDRKYMVLTEGYDGEIFLTDFIGREETACFTKEELLEIVEMMVIRWIRFGIEIKEGKYLTK